MNDDAFNDLLEWILSDDYCTREGAYKSFVPTAEATD